MRVSIIIAAHGRPDSLRRLLQSIARQIHPGRHEIIVAENGTPAPLDLSGVAPALTHIHDPRPGKCRGQNQAAGQASGECLAFLDDDVVVASDYLQELERFFDEQAFAAMKGRILPAENPALRVGPRAVYLDLPLVDHGEQVVEVRGVVGANMAFRAGALKAAGLFDERLGPGAAGHEEETEISARLRRAGFRVGYAPRVVVYHEVDPARANRERFLLTAWERGRCRTLHERHRPTAVAIDLSIAAVRLALARTLRAPLTRVAREEKRLAIARGMLAGLRQETR